MADLDHFKTYNDHYGHLARDACLKKVADALKSAISGSNDLACRYGGEEFSIVLPDTDKAGVVHGGAVAPLQSKNLGSPYNKRRLRIDEPGDINHRTR